MKDHKSFRGPVLGHPPVEFFDLILMRPKYINYSTQSVLGASSNFLGSGVCVPVPIHVGYGGLNSADIFGSVCHAA